MGTLTQQSRRKQTTKVSLQPQRPSIYEQITSLLHASGELTLSSPSSEDPLQVMVLV